jgi:hypothetical protein
VVSCLRFAQSSSASFQCSLHGESSQTSRKLRLSYRTSYQWYLLSHPHAVSCGYANHFLYLQLGALYLWNPWDHYHCLPIYFRWSVAVALWYLNNFSTQSQRATNDNSLCNPAACNRPSLKSFTLAEVNSGFCYFGHLDSYLLYDNFH